MAERSDPARRTTYLLDSAERTASASGPALIAPDGQRINLPGTVYEAVKHVIEALYDGLGVTVEPVRPVIPLTEAGHVIGMSTKTLRSYVDEGRLATTERDGVREVALTELLALHRDVRRGQREWLDEMGQEAHESGEYDARADPPPPMR